MKKRQITLILSLAALGFSTGAFGGGMACLSNYILVPGDIDYKTTKFCIMNYEAKCGLLAGSGCTAQKSSRKPVSDPYGTPWVSVSQNTAMSECASLGKGFQLISHEQWMTVAANAAENAANWCTAAGASCGTQGASITAAAVTSGSLVLARGHSDNSPGSACDGASETVETDCTTAEPGATSHTEKRTHTLKNGEVIWDLGGNVREWTSYFNKSDKPYDATDGNPVGSYRQYNLIDAGFTTMTLTDLIPSGKSFWSSSWTSSQNIGQYYAQVNGSGGALLRGGSWSVASNAGLFSARLAADPTNTYPDFGFRCVARPAL